MYYIRLDLDTYYICLDLDTYYICLDPKIYLLHSFGSQNLANFKLYFYMDRVFIVIVFLTKMLKPLRVPKNIIYKFQDGDRDLRTNAMESYMDMTFIMI